VSLRITLDAGHTEGYNRGACGDYSEGTAMFILSQHLKRKLEGRGHEVFLTRKELKDNPSLEERGRTAGKTKSELFLSLHSNAFDEKESGVLHFISLRRNSKELSDHIGVRVAEEMNKKTGITYFRGSETKAYPKTKDLDYYAVIREAVTHDCVKHAILLELGFHSNLKECEYLRDVHNLISLAEVIAHSIDVYYNYKEVEESSELPADIREGEEVLFVGGGVYRSAYDKDPVRTVEQTSRCTVTRIVSEAPNSYHCISVEEPLVYGWVKEGSLIKEVGVEEPTEGRKIIEASTVTVNQMMGWAINKKADPLFVSLAERFYNEATRVGINPALAYAQSAKETGYMKFGGVLDKTFKNPCGLKTPKGGGDTDPEAHTRFGTWSEGIKAQVDHLALYAGHEDYPKKDSPDPRHFPYLKGKSVTVEELGTKWAPSETYGLEILTLMEEMESVQNHTRNPIYEIVEKDLKTEIGGLEEILTHSPIEVREIVIETLLKYHLR